MPIDQFGITYKIEEESGVTSQDFKQFQQTARLTAVATVDSPTTDNSATIQNDPRAPKIGSAHPYRALMFATTVTCRKVSVARYEFDLSYTSRGRPGQSPLDEPPVIEYDCAISEEAVDTYVDDNGVQKPIIMITGEQFDPPLRETQYDQVVRVSRNLAYVDPDLMSRYAGAVNNDNFLGLPPGTVKITAPPRAKSASWDTFTYYQASIEFTIRRGVLGLYDDSKAWYRRLLAQGYYVAQLNVVTNKNIVIRAKDGEGNYYAKPLLHDKTTGLALAVNADTGLQDPTKAQWYEIPPRKRLPFAALQVTN